MAADTARASAGRRSSGRLSGSGGAGRAGRHVARQIRLPHGVRARRAVVAVTRAVCCWDGLPLREQARAEAAGGGGSRSTHKRWGTASSGSSPRWGAQPRATRPPRVGARCGSGFRAGGEGVALDVHTEMVELLRAAEGEGEVAASAAPRCWPASATRDVHAGGCAPAYGACDRRGARGDAAPAGGSEGHPFATIVAGPDRAARGRTRARAARRGGGPESG